MIDNTELNCTNCCVGDFMGCGFCDKEICKEYKAIGNADDFIKAVQNKVLDKIKAEIEQEYNKYRNMSEKWDERACGIGMALEIIDKYRGEET